MSSTYKFHMVPFSDISVGDRQRKELGKLDSLADSILRYGLIHPIVITRFGQLIAGERRLKAIESLGASFPSWPAIPCHFFEELDPFQLKALELEENLRREGLTWQEECLAYLDYHNARSSQDEDWSIDATADCLGASERAVSRRIAVAKELRAENPIILKCDTMTAAFNILDRGRQRAIDTELADMALIESGQLVLDPIDSGEKDSSGSVILDRPTSSNPLIRPATDDIHLNDFRTWATSYRGEPFNLLHCDFPYGINFHESDQSGIELKENESYDDSSEVYWKLVDTFLINQDRFISTSAHCLFWFSMNNYQKTMEAFTESGWSVNPMPLIWYKSDGIGILPDSKRGPRQVYETAFLMSRGDRKIIRATSNVASVAAKRDQSKHPSEKPFPVMTQFLSMLVDGTTRLLDPTCGCGTSLWAGEFLGAKSVMGLEINSVHVETARGILNRHRNSVLSRKLDLVND